MDIKIGDTFDYWTVIASGPRDTTRRTATWIVRCVCGKTRKHRSDVLRKSKGCHRCSKRFFASNGKTATPEGQIWTAMLRRCYNKNVERYPIYGGRGITVCKRWRESIDAFIEDMNAFDRPHGSQIDRIDNDQGYHCGKCSECLANEWKQNCRWASPYEQSRNRGNNVKITYQGRTLCLADWAIELNTPYTKLYKRIVIRRWPVEKAFTCPTMKNQNSKT